MKKAFGENDICSKCGKCCRLIQSGKSFEELQSLAESGDKTAINFLKLFLPYTNQEDAEKIDEIYVKRAIQTNKVKYGSDFETHFYHCRYLDEENNTCKVYDLRPKLCREYPKSAFSVIPEDCAYEGYLFEASEDIKRYIRKIKEELMNITFYKQNCNTPNEFKKYENLEKKYIMLIEKYRNNGSENW